MPPDAEASRIYSGIRRKILISILLAACIPLLIVSSFILLQFKQAYESRTESHLEELVRKHTQNIDTFLQERLANVLEVVWRTSLNELSTSATLAAVLDELQRVYGRRFVDMGVVSPDGVQVAYAGPFQLEKVSYAQAPWFQAALELETTISDVFLGTRGFPHFIVTVRKRDRGRNWIVRATIDFGAFQELVQNISIGTTGFAYIINEQGTLQTHSRQIPESYQGFLTGLARGETDAVRVFQARLPNGPEAVLAVAPLKDGDWLFIFQQHAREVFSELNKSIVISLVLILAGTGGIVSTAVILSSKMITRIRKVNAEKEALNAQMVEAGKMAAIGELAAGIAHEINNPVAIMVEEAGWVEDLLQEEALSSEYNEQEIRSALREIAVQGQRSKDITHKLLSFARKTDSAEEEIDLGELLNEILGVSSRQAQYSSVAITAQVEKGLPRVKASPSELQQVFLNLIKNAVDAMEKEGGELFIHFWSDEDWITLEFRDTGPGIPQEDLKRIFEPFYTTKPVGKGTGIGLSICYGIISRMGGQIEAESEKGQGTLIRIRLPRSSDVSSA